ncbi:MAG TPA: hypothetical protein VIU63_06705 [Nitrospira sp.]
MVRTFKLIDLAAFLGTVTTILGIYLCLSFLFLPASFGATQTDAVVKGSADFQVSMRWIQPILGQAIVEHTLIKQQQANRIDGEPAQVPHRPTMVSHRPESSPSSSYVETLRADHVDRVQWVIGRLIVELTRHRIQAGVSTTDWLANEGNQRIIAIAQRTAEQMNDAFKAEWQVRIGQAIVTETKNRASEEVGLIF